MLQGPGRHIQSRLRSGSDKNRIPTPRERNEVSHRFVLDGYMPQNSSDSIDAYIEVWEYPNGTMEVVDVDVGVNNADAESAICCEVD